MGRPLFGRVTFVSMRATRINSDERIQYAVNNSRNGLSRKSVETARRKRLNGGARVVQSVVRQTIFSDSTFLSKGRISFVHLRSRLCKLSEYVS